MAMLSQLGIYRFELLIIQYFLGICLFACFPQIHCQGFSVIFYEKGVHIHGQSDAEVVSK